MSNPSSSMVSIVLIISIWLLLSTSMIKSSEGITRNIGMIIFVIGYIYIVSLLVIKIKKLK